MQKERLHMGNLTFDTLREMADNGEVDTVLVALPRQQFHRPFPHGNPLLQLFAGNGSGDVDTRRVRIDKLANRLR
jgi:hypothetical protein